MTTLLLHPPLTLTLVVLNTKVNDVTKDWWKLCSLDSGVKRIVSIQASKMGNPAWVALTVQFTPIFCLTETVKQACGSIIEVVEAHHQ